ncbi:Ig-like domain-containing protein [Microbacterium sp. NEAU-LLC]|uniref:Ig-like domain-containing protein n=1 Tax=Microbacterium helvum TaxID=2773713 RepID=A0ABR8NN49_9MICO|nr:Ig-like domain-containing protein [Microbacterium helvum]MBD3942085.1 Ig-like domain-containing protein [Microbacterium helvum]
MEHTAARARTRTVWAALIGIAALAASLLNPLPAHAGLAESHTFASWKAYINGGADVTSTADTTTRHGGSAALRLVDTTPKAANVYGGVVQTVTVTPSTTYEFTAWTKAQDVPSSGPLQFVMSPDWTVRQTFPGGTYDWTKSTWTYTTTDTQTALNYRLIQQNTGTYWVDDLTMAKSGTTENLIANPGFEDYTTTPTPTDPTLSVRTPVMLFDASGAQVSVASNRASVQWTLTDAAGTTLDEGDAATTAGTATLSFSGLELGYYGLSISVDAGTVVRNTSFAVLGDRDGSNDTAFGVSDHLQSKPAQADVFGDLGASGARFDLSWSSVEQTKGVYTFDAARDAKIDAIIAQGTRPLLILDYRNKFYDDNLTPSTPEGIAGFAAYAAAVAAHYGTDVDYEVYNEYNIGFNDGRCGRTADCYLQVLAPTYTAIKAAVPGATVVGPAIAGIDLPWFTRLFELGGLDYLDVVSVHNYDYPNAPEGRGEAKAKQLAQLIRDYNDGADKPLWMTEYGWSTASAINTDAEQAKYLARGSVLLQAAGVDKMFVYDLLEDGTDAANREHRFGLLRNGGDGLTSLAPKQGYVAYAVLTRMLDGLAYVGPGDVETGAYAYEYADAAATATWVLWSSTPKTVHVASTSDVIVTDLFGASTTYTPEDGAVELTLGAQPVYVSGGGVTDVASPLAATYAATAPAVVALAEGFGVTVTVDNTARPNASTDLVTFRTASTQVRVPSKPGQVTAATLAAPAIDAAGQTQVGVDVVRGGVAVAHLDVPVNVVDNQATVTAKPLFSADDGSAQLAVSIDNRSVETPLVIDGLTWNVGDIAGEAPESVTVAPGSTQVLTFDVTGYALWTPYDYAATVTFSDGFQRTVSGKTTFAPVVLEGDAHSAADLDATGTFIQLSNEPGPTVGGTMWVGRTDAGIVVHAAITDPAHDPAGAASQLYNGDSIQLSFAPGLPAANGPRVEYGVALLDSGVGTYKFSSPAAAVTLPGTEVVRDEAAKTTTYTVPLTWAQIGVDAASESFSYSFLVNDAANGVRMGYIEWASGIGKTKDVTQHLPLTFATAAPEAPEAESVRVFGGESVVVGGDLALTAAVAPEGADQGVAWSSSDPAVAAVADDGTVHAIAEGTVAVTATAAAAPGVTASHIIRVLPAAWSADRTYAAGDRVSYEGAVYVAQWYASASEVPGVYATGAWAEEGALTACAAGDARAWTTSGVYDTGAAVVHHGHRWTAKWWTRGDEPGVGKKSPWKDAGAC